MDEDGGSVRLRLVADVAAPTSYNVTVTLMDGTASCKHFTCYDYIFADTRQPYFI